MLLDPRTLVRNASTLLLALILGATSGCRNRSNDVPAALPDEATANAAVVAWRAKHEADYRRDWVSIAGLHTLKPGHNTAGSAPTNDIVLPPSTPPSVGGFTLIRGTGATGSNNRGTGAPGSNDVERVRFEPTPGVRVLLDGEPVTAATELRDDGEGDADELVIGNVRLVVHVSGDSRAIRVRDPNGPLARGFLGFTWFPIDAQYRVIGRFIKDPQPQRFKVLNTYGDVDEYATEGIVEFELLGRTHRLRPFTTRPKRFYFVFRDESSGQETYETARFLYSDLRDDGTTVLDFNMAYNPPCAFNPHTTCPIPLRENRLRVKVLAGEKAYPVHVPLPSGVSK